MKISTNNGNFFASTSNEIRELIKKSLKQLCNELWISEEEYPCISLIIKDDYANINFFLNDEGDIWQSIGKNDDLEFIVNGEVQIISGDYIIPLENAIVAVEEFLITKNKPKCVEWEEL